MVSRKIMIVDFGHSGHHAYYINQILRFAPKILSKQNRLVFYLPPTLKSSLVYPIKNDFIAINYIPDSIIERYSSSNVIKRSFIISKWTRNQAIKELTDEVIHMKGNSLIPGAMFINLKLPTSFILFHPTFREEANSIIKRLRLQLKEKFYTSIFNKKNVSRIFILNDEKCVEHYNSILKQEKCVLLNDPTIPIKRNKTLNSEKIAFSHLGSLSERKGTLKLLNSIFKLHEKDIYKSKFIIAGRSNKEFEELIEERILLLKTKFPKIDLVYHKDYLKEEKFEEFLLNSHSLVLPYDNPQSSSGLVGHSISNGKHVICPNKGLIGEQLTKYGYCSLYEKDSELINCIKGFIRNRNHFNINYNFQKQFIIESSPLNFVSKLLFSISTCKLHE